MSGFPEKKGLTSGEVQELAGKFGELAGKFGKLSGNLWIPVKFHSAGKFGKLPGKSWDFPEARGSLTPLPATRQICLQAKESS